jgi:L-amino acid N-acyltransferase YncA
VPVETTIRAATAEDAADLVRIYNHYIATTVITFEEAELSGADMLVRLREIDAVGLPWLVAQSAAGVNGFAYASRWKGRCAYRYSVESTIYLEPAAWGQGLGTVLYSNLLARLQQGGSHTVIGGIALPNAASVALHEKLGLQKIAHFAEVGFKLGRWVDVGYWQKVFEGP